MSLLDQMPHESTIRRRTSAKGTLGGRSESYTDEQTEVECWEQQASSGESREYEKRGMTLTSKIYFPTDPGVSNKHQILITERSGVTVSSPIALDVLSEALPDASAGFGILWKVMAGYLTSERD